MELGALIKRLGCRTLTAAGTEAKEIRCVYAGDRMSDLLSAASEDTLIVTHLTNQGIVRLIELMEVPAVCFLNGVHPEEAVSNAAIINGICLMTSPSGMYETCGRLYQLMNFEKQSARTP